MVIKNKKAKMLKAKRKTPLPYFLTVPAILLFGTFTFFPFAKTILYSFAKISKSGQFEKWVGTVLWGKILGNSETWTIVGATLKFAAVNMVLTFFVALLFALLCVKVCKGNKLYQTLFAIPMAIASSPAAAIWLFIYRQDAGLLNQIFGTNIDWLHSENTALMAISIVTAWMHIGHSFLFLMVGFRNVPEDLIEAATLDGAGAWTRTVKVLIPMASPQIFYVVFLNITSAFKSFAQIRLLTGGSFGTKTLVMASYTARNSGNYTYSYIYSIMLFIIIFVVTRIQFMFEKRLVHYQ